MPAAGCPRARIRRITRITNLRRSSPYSPHHSLFAIRCFHSLLAARHLLLAVFFHSPFAIRHSPSFSLRHSRFAPFGGCPQTAVWRHLVIVGARHASPLPFPYRQIGVRERPCPSPQALVRRQDAEAKDNRGGFGTRPYNDPTIRNWQFAIRRLSPFTIHHSPFAIRDSQSFSIRHSLFAIRRFPRSLLAARGSPSLASRHSPYPRSPFLPFGSDRPCVSERFPSEVRGGCGERSRRGSGPAPRTCCCFGTGFDIEALAKFAPQ
jgi:hypothetical protein